MSTNVFLQITELLDENEVTYRHLHHEPTRTSEDSARVRGEDLETGAKALLIKVDKTFKLFVLSAAQKLDSRKIRAYFGARKSRFASSDELMDLTGLVPGSVPPFGHPILNFDLYVDTSITLLTKVAYNAGALTDSIIMDTHAYLKLAQPTVFNFAA